MVLILSLFLAPAAFPQNLGDLVPAPPSEGTEGAETTEAQEPISLVDVLADYQELLGRRAELEGELATTEVADGLASRLEEAADEFREAFGDSTPSFDEETRTQALIDVETEARHQLEILGEVVDELEARVRELEEDLEDLESRAGRWSELATAAEEKQAPAVVQEKVAEAQPSLASLEGSVRTRRDETLALLSRALELHESLAAAQTAATERRRQLKIESSKLEGAPIWSLGWTGRDLGTIRHSAASDRESVRSFLAAQGWSTGISATICVGLTLFLVLFLRRGATDVVESDPHAEVPLRALRSPVPVALFLGLVLWSMTLRAAPSVVFGLLVAVLLPLAGWILVRLLGKTVAGSVVALAAAGVLLPLRDHLEQVPLLERWVLLGQVLLVGIVFATGLRRGRWQAALAPYSWGRTCLFGLRLLVGVLGVAALGAVLGWVGVARVLRTGVIGSLVISMILAVLGAVAYALVSCFVQVGPGYGFRFVERHPNSVRRVSRRTLGTLVVTLAGFFALSSFDQVTHVGSWLKAVLSGRLSIGSYSIGVVQILTFVAVILATLFLARLIVLLLGDEVLSRLDLNPGTPYAITTITRYSVLLIGFTLAALAAGLDWSQVAILAGALSVGIGFGLQTIVNNFICGLILLFEQPVQVRDVIEVAGYKGVVTRIGIRSSTVQTFDGAEVLVPNADLITGDVVNWTLSNQRRRLEIAVGAEYGTDPQRVVDLLGEVAGTVDGVSADPPPVGLFVGFGDSALDFQLRCWVDRLDDAVRVASELHLAVDRAFSEAGLSMPFPQRDLHVRSLPDGWERTVPKPQEQPRNSDDSNQSESG